jgi:hypothetical protein
MQAKINYFADCTIWTEGGRKHREDGPAVIWASGGDEWWFNGKRHRSDGPAVLQPDGRKEWWIFGKLHREDGPAIIHADGCEEWFLNNFYQPYYRGKTNWLKEGF